MSDEIAFRRSPNASPASSVPPLGDYRNFTFGKVARLFGRCSRSFVGGTRVAREAALLLQEAPVRTAAK
jgi:hypothetical protein